ncbi:MAG: YihY/virulence factor BrkB family protein [Alphaproteobacteria bacterium]
MPRPHTARSLDQRRSFPAAGTGSHDAGQRGHTAETPSDIPPAGWKDVLKRVYNRLSEDRVLVISAGITFYSLLALFPAIAALVSIYGFFADPASITQLVSNLSTVLPGGGIDVIKSQITRLTTSGSTTLGLATVISLLIALWSANAGVKALFDGLNVAYREREKRSFIVLNVVSLCFTLGMIAFALVALGAIVVLPYVANAMGAFGQWAIEIGKWPVLLALVVFVFACLYRFGPSRDAPQWRWITWGSAVAAIVWLIASILFSWYAANFGSYNKTYGSLGAVVGFMTWMWISTIVFLAGGMVNAELEHQTRKDTTEGEPESDRDDVAWRH